jgi:hypothetical protein
MGIAWQPVVAVLLVASMSLIIPLAIILGHRQPGGALLFSGAGSLVAFSALWLVFDGASLLDGTNASPDGGLSAGMIARGLLIALGTFLLIAAWTLALNAAAQARRWAWTALLVLAGFLSFAALLAALFVPDPCLVGPPAAAGYCTPAPAAQTLIIAGSLTGPAAALAYRLRATVPWRAGRPEGLGASRLGAADDAGGPARHPDSDLRTEQL